MATLIKTITAFDGREINVYKMHEGFKAEIRFEDGLAYRHGDRLLLDEGESVPDWWSAIATTWCAVGYGNTEIEAYEALRERLEYYKSREVKQEKARERRLP